MQLYLMRKKYPAFLIFWLLTVSGPAMAVDDRMSDEAMESFLMEAEVIRIDEMLPGSTYPMALELERFGMTRRAAYKYRPADLVDTQEISLGSPPADSFLYEAAAYRLDRALGLGMVPVTVIRNVHAEGAVIEWVSDAVSMQSLLESGDLPQDSQQLNQQLAVMDLFDALISNGDRKPSDQLITPSDGKLYLLDHSRSFRISDELPHAFLSRPARLPRALLHRLIQLNRESLRELLEGLVTDEQIESLLRRRDAIVQKISADLRKYDDSEVFQD